MPSPFQDDLEGSRLLEHLRDVGQLDAGGLESAEHLRHPRDGEVDVAGHEGVLRHDVAARGDDLDAVEALLLEVALVERDVVARRTAPAGSHCSWSLIEVSGSKSSSAGSPPPAGGARGERERCDGDGGRECDAAPVAESHVLFLSCRWCRWCRVMVQAGYPGECLVTSRSSSDVTRKNTRPMRMPPSDVGPGQGGAPRLGVGRDRGADAVGRAAEVLGDEGRDHRERTRDPQAGHEVRQRRRQGEHAEQSARWSRRMRASGRGAPDASAAARGAR